MTTIEYALLIALVAVVSFVGINRVQDGSSDELVRKSSAGTPDLDVGTTTTIPPSSTSSPPGTSPSTTVVSSAVTVTLTGTATATDKGNKWIASVMVVVTDAGTGATLPSVAVSGGWSNGGQGSCITQAGGACPITLEKELTNGTDSMTFTATAVSGDGVGPPGSLPSIVIDKP